MCIYALYDFEMDFDRVNHKKLSKNLKLVGIDAKDVRIITLFLPGNSIRELEIWGLQATQ